MEPYFLLLKFVLIFLIVVFGFVYLIIKAISYPAEKKGKELLQHLRSNTYDVRKILGEMRYIAEVNFELYDEYNRNKANARKSILFGLSVFIKQDKLLLAMNRNVKAEWVPRFKFLKEIQNSFYKDSDLYNAYIKYKDVDKAIKKLTLWYINLTNLYESIMRTGRFALKSAAIGAIAAIVVGGVILPYIVKKTGRNIGT